MVAKSNFGEKLWRSCFRGNVIPLGLGLPRRLATWPWPCYILVGTPTCRLAFASFRFLVFPPRRCLVFKPGGSFYSKPQRGAPPSLALSENKHVSGSPATSRLGRLGHVEHLALQDFSIQGGGASASLPSLVSRGGLATMHSVPRSTTTTTTAP